MKRPTMVIPVLAVATATLATAASGASAGAPGSARHDRSGGWVNAWQGSPVQGATIAGSGCPADVGLKNQTVRNIVAPTAGGRVLRVRLSNAFGTTPLHLSAASVALAGTGAAAVPGST